MDQNADDLFSALTTDDIDRPEEEKELLQDITPDPIEDENVDDIDGFDGLTDEDDDDIDIDDLINPGDEGNSDSFEETTLPSWSIPVFSHLKSSTQYHSFLFFGNVHDYMIQTFLLPTSLSFLFQTVAEEISDAKKSLLLSISRSEGITIFQDQDEKELKAQQKLLEKYIGSYKTSQGDGEVDLTIDKEIFTFLTYLYDETNDVNLCVFIHNPEYFIPLYSIQGNTDQQIVLEKLNYINRNEREGFVALFYITDNKESIAKDFTLTHNNVFPVDVPLPLFAERKNFIDTELIPQGRKTSDGLDIISQEETLDDSSNALNSEYIALNTAGLSKHQLESVLDRATAKDCPITLNLIQNIRRDLIEQDYRGLLSVLDTRSGFDDLGGMQHIKDFFMHEIIEPIKRGETETVPMGVMLMGPPGTSKAFEENTLVPVFSDIGGELFRPIKNLKPGDKIYDGFTADLIEVSGVHFKGETELFLITLEDTCEPLLVSEDHLLWARIVESETDLKRSSYTAEDFTVMSAGEVKGKLEADDSLQIYFPHIDASFKGIGVAGQAKTLTTQEILSIEKTDTKAPTVCISTTSPTQSFLVGRDYITTHNTALSKAVAFESGMNCVSMDLSVILSGDTENAEHELSRAFAGALAMQPTIIFIDEIDEALPKRHTGTSSGVVQRITQKILSFFSDTSHRGEVIMLAATNYPEKVDSAIKRIGRFDVRVPLFAPSGFDRLRIIKIMANRKQYTISAIENPDILIPNPFVHLREFVEGGNVSNTSGFTGRQREYTWQDRDPLSGEMYEYTIYLPEFLLNMIGAEQITLEEFYRATDILLKDRLAGRGRDMSSAQVEPERVYFKRIQDTIKGTCQDLFGSDEYNLNTVVYRLQIFEKIYRPFMDKTEFMTGAELERVMAKAIVLTKEYQASYPEEYNQLIENEIIADERDIPYMFVYEASTKIIGQSSGVKSMEDFALIDTTDKDFIPDAKYGITNDGKEISYLERQHSLVIRQRTAD